MKTPQFTLVVEFFVTRKKTCMFCLHLARMSEFRATTKQRKINQCNQQKYMKHLCSVRGCLGLLEEMIFLDFPISIFCWVCHVMSFKLQKFIGGHVVLFFLGNHHVI